MYKKFGQFIDGKWKQSSDKKTYEVINPANEEIIGNASKATPKDVDDALKSAEKGSQKQCSCDPHRHNRCVDHRRMLYAFVRSTRNVRHGGTGREERWDVF